jgi:pre-rRNA-processing protein IPI3
MTDAIEIALISDDSGQLNSISVWDVRNGTQLMQYRGGGASHKSTLNVINGKFLVTANNVKPLLNFWALNNSDTIQNIKFVMPARVNCLSVSNDGLYLVAGIKENIYIWQISTGKMLTMLTKHYQNVNCIKFTDDGSHFVSGGEDGQVIVWNLSAVIGDRFSTDNIEALHVFSDHALPVTDLWIGIGGLSGLLATSSKDRTCKIYDMASGTLLLSLVFQEIITCLTLDRIETSLFIGTSQGNIYHHRLQPPPRTREYHITNDDEINNKFKGHTKGITCLAISLDEQTLLSGSEDFNVIIWNIQSRSLLKILPFKGVITNAIFMSSNKVMFNHEEKLELVSKNFQRMISNADNKEIVEVVHDMSNEEPENILQCYTNNNSNNSHKYSRTTRNDNSDTNDSKAELERLKKVNKELFDYCAKNVMT